MFKILHNLEKQKHLEPKFSLSLVPLVRFLYNKGSMTGSIIIALGEQSSSTLDHGKSGSTFNQMLFNDQVSVNSYISIDSKNSQKHARLTSLRFNPQQEMASSQGRSNKGQRGTAGDGRTEEIETMGLNQFSMQEKSIEEEDDAVDNQNAYFQRLKNQENLTQNPQLSAIQQNDDLKQVYQIVQQESQNQDDIMQQQHYQQQKLQLNKINLLEPVMRGKYSGRTLSVQPRNKFNSKLMHTQANFQTQSKRGYYQGNRDEMLRDIYNDAQQLKEIMESQSLDKARHFTTIPNLTAKRNYDGFQESNQSTFMYRKDGNNSLQKILITRPETEIKSYKATSQLSHYSNKSDISEKQTVNQRLNDSSIINEQMIQYQLVKSPSNQNGKHIRKKQNSFATQQLRKTGKSQVINMKKKKDQFQIPSLYSQHFIRPKFAQDLNPRNVHLQNLNQLARIHDEYRN